MNRSDILNTAREYITKDRAATHGEAEDSFDAISSGWQWWMEVRRPGPLCAFDTAMMMVIFKAARMAGNQAHIDNAIDLCGYAALAGEIGAIQAQERAQEIWC